MGDFVVQLFGVITGDTGVHVVLYMPIHPPVEELCQGIEGDRAGTFAKVGDVLLQTAVLGYPHKVGSPIRDERKKGQNDGQDP